MLGALHPGCLETVTELQTSYSRDREYSMCYCRLYAVPERLTISGVDLRHGTLHHRSKAVSFFHGLVDCLLPCLLVRTSSKFHQPGIDLLGRRLIKNGQAIKHLLRYNSGSNNRQGKPSREMTAAARILIVIPFQCCCQVCMARTRHSSELAVVG